jgi:hypothetical protein
MIVWPSIMQVLLIAAILLSPYLILERKIDPLFGSLGVRLESSEQQRVQDVG